MNSKEFNYDVAFSFTQQDEELAYTLYNLLNDRLKCFIYSEEQKKLAGGDGESLFNSIFSVESRIVVILFRTEYGITKWTRIEETAIRNRGYDEGYDFVILIPTENQVNPPKWLPKNRLWIGLNRWGIEAAAGVIEARVQEFGGVVKIESIADKTARAEMELNEKKKREDLLNSTQAIFLAREEIENLKKIFRTHVEDILQKTQNWHIKLRENRHDGIDVLSYGYILYFHFYQQWANTLHDTYLFVAIFKGYFDENGNVTDPFSENIIINSIKLQFDINALNQKGWSLKDTRDDFMTSQKIGDTWFSEFVATAVEGRKENY